MNCTVAEEMVMRWADILADAASKQHMFVSEQLLSADYLQVLKAHIVFAECLNRRSELTSKKLDNIAMCAASLSMVLPIDRDSAVWLNQQYRLSLSGQDEPDAAESIQAALKHTAQASRVVNAALDRQLAVLYEGFR